MPNQKPMWTMYLGRFSVIKPKSDLLLKLITMLMETWQYLGSTLTALRQSVPAYSYLVESCETLLSTVMSAKPGEVIVGHDIMATDQTDHLLFFSNAFYHLRMIVALQNCYQVFGIKVTRIFESLKDNFLLVNFHQNNHFSVIQTTPLRKAP